MKILFIGDIYGRPGRKILKDSLVDLKNREEIDLVIANCENSAAGKGVTEKTINELFLAGVDVFTSGNHLWDKKDSFSFIEREERILKPANFPKKSVGNEFFIKNIKNKKIGIFCLCGQGFMNTIHSPFFVVDELLEKFNDCDIYFLDFHAESTAEKRAMGHYLNGRVTAVCGTHTHIQTADEEILSGGTAYITDVGMTGPHDSVIGVKKNIIIDKMFTGMPVRYEVAEKGVQINAVIVEIDKKNNKAINIKRIKEKYE